MNLFELSAFLCVLVGGITGAVAGALHSPLGFVLGGAGGLAVGFCSFMGAMSPLALVGGAETRDIPEKLVNVAAGTSFFVLIPFAPIGAGIASWWLVRLISG